MAGSRIAIPKQAMPPSPKDIAGPQHRELYFFALFRVLESGILGIVAFTPLGLTMAEIRAPMILKTAAAGYFVVGAVLLWLSRREDVRLRRQAATGLLLDVQTWRQEVVTAATGPWPERASWRDLRRSRSSRR